MIWILESVHGLHDVLCSSENTHDLNFCNHKCGKGWQFFEVTFLQNGAIKWIYLRIFLQAMIYWEDMVKVVSKSMH